MITEIEGYFGSNGKKWHVQRQGACVSIMASMDQIEPDEALELAYAIDKVAQGLKDETEADQ